MRVSLTADPVEEVVFAREILSSIGLRKSAVDLVSCPTCGRTKIDLQKLALQVEKKLGPIEEKLTAESYVRREFEKAMKETMLRAEDKVVK